MSAPQVSSNDLTKSGGTIELVVSVEFTIN